MSRGALLPLTLELARSAMTVREPRDGVRTLCETTAAGRASTCDSDKLRDNMTSVLNLVEV
jgi:hypothetical protein